MPVKCNAVTTDIVTLAAMQRYQDWKGQAGSCQSAGKRASNPALICTSARNSSSGAALRGAGAGAGLGAGGVARPLAAASLPATHQFVTLLVFALLPQTLL